MDRQRTTVGRGCGDDGRGLETGRGEGVDWRAPVPSAFSCGGGESGAEAVVLVGERVRRDEASCTASSPRFAVGDAATSFGKAVATGRGASSSSSASDADSGAGSSSPPASLAAVATTSNSASAAESEEAAMPPSVSTGGRMREGAGVGCSGGGAGSSAPPASVVVIGATPSSASAASSEDGAMPPSTSSDGRMSEGAGVGCRDGGSSCNTNSIIPRRHVEARQAPKRLKVDVYYSVLWGPTPCPPAQ